MNKNIIKLIAILVMCFMIGAVLVACGTQGPVGPKGDKGDSVQGVPGEDGKDGKDGTVVTIGDDGYFYLDGVKTEWFAGKNTECADGDHDLHWEVIRPHTADSTGIDLGVCEEPNCGFAQWNITEHEYVKTVRFDDCVNGLVYEFVCSCGLIDEAQTVVERAPGHDVPAFDATYGATNVGEGWVRAEDQDVVVDYECERQAAYVQACARCNEDVIKLADPRKHKVPAFDINNPTANGWVLAENETGKCSCEIQPAYAYKCDNKCGYEEVELGNAINHAWGEWKVVTAATPVAAGLAKRECNNTCTVCGKCVDTIVLPKLDETNYTVTGTPASCEAAGALNYTYKGDANGKGAGIVVEYKPAAIGHNYNNGSWTITKAPTTEAEGEISVVCKNGCGKNATAKLPKLGDAAYTFVAGDCYNKDKYSITITVVGNDKVNVDYAVAGAYRHAPAGDNKIHVEPGEYYDYHVYECPLCHEWVVADAVKRAN